VKVVLDANVLVSAAILTGPSYRLVARWLDQGDLEWEDQMPPAITPAAFEELLDSPGD